MSYADDVRAKRRTQCVHLCTKEQFVGLPSEHEEPFAFDDAIHWCDQTSEALGPDGASACGTACAKPGRTCYEGPIRP